MDKFLLGVDLLNQTRNRNVEEGSNDKWQPTPTNIDELRISLNFKLMFGSRRTSIGRQSENGTAMVYTLFF